MSERRRLQAEDIIKYLVNGLNYSQIAEKMELDRKTVYNIRHSIEYNQFFNELLDRHLQDLASFEAFDSNNMKIEAMRERGRLLRAGLPKRIHSRSERASVNLHIMDFPIAREKTRWISMLTSEERDEFMRLKARGEARLNR